MSNRAKPVDAPKPADENQSREDTGIYLGIFFDGTNNHREQASIGEKYREKIKDGHTEKEAKKQLEAEGLKYKGSALQENDQSNVALLEKHYKEGKKEGNKYAKIYIEGIGTTEEGDNKTEGSAAGTGETGIRKKVEKALSKIPEKVNSLLDQKGSLIDLHLEVFGFSRGAAAARNFVYEVIRNKYRFTSKIDCSVCFLFVDYVGLFDTVSTYGLHEKTKKNIVVASEVIAPLTTKDLTKIPIYANNVKDLKLDAIRDARYVFQICAADEFREKFALTNIKSAIDKGKGEEIFMPGAHSDIGGGYAGGKYSTTLKQEKPSGHVTEFDTYITEKRMRVLGWIADGLYRGDECWNDIINQERGDEIELNYELDNYKTTILGKIEINADIKKGYSYIALHLMKENACEKGNDSFISIRDFEIPDDLKNMDLKEKVKEFDTLEKCLEGMNKVKYKYLRQNWLHFSANEAALSIDAIGMSSRRINGILKREIIPG